MIILKDQTSIVCTRCHLNHFTLAFHHWHNWLRLCWLFLAPVLVLVVDWFDSGLCLTDVEERGRFLVERRKLCRSILLHIDIVNIFWMGSLLDNWLTESQTRHFGLKLILSPLLGLFHECGEFGVGVHGETHWQLLLLPFALVCVVHHI